MPTVRALAVELCINANTVTRVYRELQQQGLLRLERGIGTFVDRPSHETTLTESDFARISREARGLVALCRKAGLSSREVSQLIDGTWKETSQ